MSGKQSLCCHVHTATRVSAIFYLVYNLLVAMDLTVGIIRKTDPLTVSYTDMKFANGYRAFDISTNFMMLVLMSFSSVLVLLSHRKGPVCIVPFVLFMFLDVALSLLSLFAAPWGLPGTPTYRDALRLALNLKGGAKLEVQELSQVTMMFGVLFVLYILLKVCVCLCVYVYMVCMCLGLYVGCVYTCFFPLFACLCTCNHFRVNRWFTINNTTSPTEPSFHLHAKMFSESLRSCLVVTKNGPEESLSLCLSLSLSVSFSVSPSLYLCVCLSCRWVSFGLCENKNVVKEGSMVENEYRVIH
uniref:Lysosomal protein transmembrane 5 n=1 Tax=Pygocentrus nattereri TaxID=42514 RepID=A0A3B4EJK1_PYGNA